MRVPLTWLREYCSPELDVHEIEARLTLTGTKVEAIHHHGVRGADGFVVGHVLDVLEWKQARLAEAAELLGLNTANLVAFLETDAKVWEQANQLRLRFGHKPLRG